MAVCIFPPLPASMCLRMDGNALLGVPSQSITQTVSSARARKKTQTGMFHNGIGGTTQRLSHGGENGVIQKAFRMHGPTGIILLHPLDVGFEIRKTFRHPNADCFGGSVYGAITDGMFAKTGYHHVMIRRILRLWVNFEKRKKKRQ